MYIYIYTYSYVYIILCIYKNISYMCVSIGERLPSRSVLSFVAATLEIVLISMAQVFALGSCVSTWKALFTIGQCTESPFLDSGSPT